MVIFARVYLATNKRATDEDHTGAAVTELVFRKPL
jgi:hypothetical protein